MTVLSEGAAEARAQGWRALAALHARIEGEIERALQSAHALSVSEYSVLDVLSRQDTWHMRMQQLSAAVVLSQSATTRLVARLEEDGLLTRYLCATDRRGIFTEVTAAGQERLAQARPTHDAALRRALSAAEEVPELAPLVRALDAACGAVPAAG
ncbi:MarR family winged helix-turn-helix transcriptional regulator [Streptacidiphilus albus]|uniref:MarR family winged helix-turn-helix transcriptional regulator n=1 Tax=Streptacidiphilus albus TaxID=105425 RepID=UPI00054BF1D0|nr:MarR family transcriptional regulator [Streptacidiphilus albus]